MFAAWGRYLKSISWASILALNEVGVVFLFYGFLVADVCGYSICEIAARDKKRLEECKCNLDAISKTMESIKVFILGVDAPGYLGVVFIAALGLLIYPGHVAYFYWHGLIAGAICFHTAFSQASLALLAARRE